MRRGEERRGELGAFKDRAITKNLNFIKCGPVVYPDAPG